MDKNSFDGRISSEIIRLKKRELDQHEAKAHFLLYSRNFIAFDRLLPQICLGVLWSEIQKCTRSKIYLALRLLNKRLHNHHNKIDLVTINSMDKYLELLEEGGLWKS